MSTPMEYYQSLPPVTRAYALACIVSAAAVHLEILSLWTLALDYDQVFSQFEVWRLLSNFFYIGPFSYWFVVHLMLLIRYGVILEKGPFNRRTVDYVWMLFFGALSLLMMAAIPYLTSPFMGQSLIFMIVFVWSREFPNEHIDFHGLALASYYLPWTMLVMDMVVGNPIKTGLLGIAAGQLYYMF